jgi:hypothetical protein
MIYDDNETYKNARLMRLYWWRDDDEGERRRDASSRVMRIPVHIDPLRTGFRILVQSYHAWSYRTTFSYLLSPQFSTPCCRGIIFGFLFFYYFLPEGGLTDSFISTEKPRVSHTQARVDIARGRLAYEWWDVLQYLLPSISSCWTQKWKWRRSKVAILRDP